MTDKKKDSNPKDALGVKKVPLHAVPVKPLLEVGLAMMEGGRKYGTHNYREIGVRMSTYYNAAMRHLMAWWEGEDTDEDSGVPHIIKAIACLFVVRDSIHMNNCVDDRPVRYPNGIGLGVLNDIAAGLIEKYPDCALPFTHLYRHGETAPKVGDRHNGMLFVKAGEDIKVHDHSKPQDEPVNFFKAGDNVKILLWESRMYHPGRKTWCKKADYIGEYLSICEKHQGCHMIRVVVDHEYRDYIFNTDELTLMEDN